MTNDELLSKLLDNNLTQLERRELDARMASSPHFAEEVREFLAVEELLVKTKPSLVSAPEHLIEAVGKHTATTIAAAATTATLAPKIGQASFQQWITPAVLAVLLGGAALLYVTWPENKTERDAVAPSAITNSTQGTGIPNPTTITSEQTLPLPEQQKAVQTPTQKDGVRTVVAPQQTEQQPTPPAHPAIAQQAAPKPQQTPQVQPQDSLGKFSLIKQADTPQEKELLRQIELYQSSQTSGNQVLQMSTAKKIGILYRDIKQYKGSRQYLENAREIAHTLHIEEEEAIATGELGLLEKEQGNRLQAIRLVQQCVHKLAEQQSPSLQRWQEELQMLQEKE